MGKCLANVSERLPAKELLLDPFLATDQLDSPLPSPTLLKNHITNFTAEVAKEKPSMSDQTKSTDMTITGSINEEDDTVFLKVQISNKSGMHNFNSICNHIISLTVHVHVLICILCV